MKTILLSILIVCMSGTLPAQIDVFKKLERESKKRVDRGIDKGIDKSLDTVEEGVEDAIKGETDTQEEKETDKKDVSSGESSVSETKESTDKTSSKDEKKDAEPLLSWSKYDFIPGSEIIFEDNQEGEENGEFPSRWDLVEGRVENAVFDNSNVIYFMTRSSKIIPYLKNREQDYIPEEFTLEFDAWFEKDEYTSYYVYFRDVKNQEGSGPIYYPILRIKPNGAQNDKNMGKYPGKDYEWNTEKSFWRHISISFNRRAMKVYLDDSRVLNVPNMEINPTGITIEIDNYGTAGVKGFNRFIKNIRLAKGAVKLYDKLQQDGKIVSNGIRFESGKSAIKPESMGVINEIHELMEEHPDVKFSVEGHTDNVGDEDYNQKLSEQRAEAVVNKLIEMGLSKDRFVSKGHGESQPVASNDTAEGKASNRRVEFIKL
ncbi:MAG: OmpA family protein [Bacteroidales bacterium]|nr:OmpA family protein [Bacteroidales bacterium]